MSQERDPMGHRDGLCGDTAVYLLGLLDERRSAEFAEHARTCSVCSDELAALGPAVEWLAGAVPQVQAPGSAKQRVMEAVRAEATRAAKGTAHRATRRRRQARRAPIPTRALALAGASLVLALAVIAGALIGAASNRSGGSAARSVSAEVTLAGAKATLHLQGGHTWLTISGMHGPSPGHVYEVWVKYPRHTLPSATDSLFAPTSTGAASVEVPGGSSASEVMVTQEPAGGSRLPTSAPVIVARVS